MKRYNQELLNKMFNACERKGEIKNVNAEYYKEFLKLTEKQMEILIGHIIVKTSKYINNKILGNEWENDEKIYDHIKSYLEMVALGIIQIRMEDGELCFCKPVGDTPDKCTEKEFDMKIQNSAPIIEKVLLK